MKRQMNYLWMLVALLGFNAFETFAQDDEEAGGEERVCENKYGADSVLTVKNLSLFNQYFQSKKYVESFPYFYYLLTNAPCVSKNITVNGAVIIKKVMAEPEYKPRFAGLADTIMLCHELRIKFYGQEGFVKGKWANDMAKLQPSKRQEALKMFAESVQMEGNKTDYSVPTWYMEAAVKEYGFKRLSLDSVILIYDQMNAIIQHNLKANAGKEKVVERWKTAEDNINALLIPLLDCDKIIEVKKPQIEANPKDIELMKKTLVLLERGKCTGKDYYLELNEKIAAIEPNAAAYLGLAKAFRSKGNDNKAQNYYEKALSAGIEDAAEKAEAYYTLGFYSLGSGKMSQARTYARQALELKPDMGKAYILIGDAYARSSSSCSDDKMGGRSVFWAAVDKYQRAKSVDPEMAETADKRIASYAGSYPDKETAFFLGINSGDSFTVGCWIGETTTVRFSN